MTPDGLGRPGLLLIALAYLAVVLAIGLWSRRHTRDARDFFIAGQRLGLVVTAFATMSAAFSGFVFLGGPGLTYRMGIAALAINVPIGVTAAMLCWTVGRRLRRLSAVREVYTVPDAVQCRYGSRTATALAAVAIVLGVVGYLGAQLRALGVLLEPVLGTSGLGPWSLPAAMALGAAAVLVYSVLGGMVAGAYTDLVQGALMLGTAVAVFFVAFDAAGGLSALSASIADSPRFGEDFLLPFGHVPVWTTLGFYFVFSVGVLGQPHMLHKFYMIEDERKLRWMPLVLGGSQTLCLLVWVGIGLAVPALVAQGRLDPLVRPDDAAPTFLLQVAPPALSGVVLAGVLAAVMSTADSFVNVGAAALVRDLPRAFRRPLGDELRWGRWATVGLTLAAAALAWAYDDLVALLGTFAFGTFAAALVPTLAVGLAWRGATAPAVIASIATGTGLNVGLELWNRAGMLPEAPGVPPTALALAASLVVFFIVSWLTPAAPELEPEVAAALEIDP
jgi:SSS family transporter